MAEQQQSDAMTIMQVYLSQLNNREDTVNAIAERLRETNEASGATYAAQSEYLDRLRTHLKTQEASSARISLSIGDNDSALVRTLKDNASAQHVAYIKAKGDIEAQKLAFSEAVLKWREQGAQEAEKAEESGLKKVRTRLTDLVIHTPGTEQESSTEQRWFDVVDNTIQQEQLQVPTGKGSRRAAALDAWYETLNSQLKNQPKWQDEHGDKAVVGSENVKAYLKKRFGAVYGRDYGVVKATGDSVRRSEILREVTSDEALNEAQISGAQAYDPNIATRLALIKGESGITAALHHAVYNRLSIENPEKLGHIESADELHRFLSDTANDDQDLYHSLSSTKREMSDSIKDIQLYTDPHYVASRKQELETKADIDAKELILDETREVRKLTYPELMQQANQIYIASMAPQYIRNRVNRWKEMAPRLGGAFGNMSVDDAYRAIETMKLDNGTKKKMRKVLMHKDRMGEDEWMEAAKILDEGLKLARENSLRLPPEMQQKIAERGKHFGVTYRNQEGEVTGIYFQDELIPIEDITYIDLLAQTEANIQNEMANMTEEEKAETEAQMEEYRDVMANFEKHEYGSMREKMAAIESLSGLLDVPVEPTPIEVIEQQNAPEPIVEEVVPTVEEPVPAAVEPPVVEEVMPAPAPAGIPQYVPPVHGTQQQKFLQVPEAEPDPKEDEVTRMIRLETGGIGTSKAQGTHSLALAETTSDLLGSITAKQSRETGETTGADAKHQIYEGSVKPLTGADLHPSVVQNKGAIQSMAAFGEDFKQEDLDTAFAAMNPDYHDNEQVRQQMNTYYRYLA